MHLFLHTIYKSFTLLISLLSQELEKKKRSIWSSLLFAWQAEHIKKCIWKINKYMSHVIHYLPQK